jgi:hypothetical protein
MGLYETQKCLGKSLTLMLILSKNKFKVCLFEK